MIAIIIDSNIFYGDPLWRGSAFKKILYFSKHKTLKILISDVVIKEVIRNSKKEYDQNYKAIKEGISGIGKLVEGFDQSFMDQIPNDFDEKIAEKFSLLQKDGLIEIIYPEQDMLDELIDRAVDKIKPFSEKKEEFRDAVIWLSCIRFSQSISCEKTYFISKNISDFCEKKGSEDLHKDLKRDCPNAQLKTSIHDFLSAEEEHLLQQLEKAPVIAMQSWLEEEAFDEDSVTQLLQDHLYSTLSGEISAIVDGWEPSDFYPNVHTGYIQSYERDELKVVDGSLSFDVSSEFVTISGSVCSYLEVEVYEYNPVYDDSSEKYSYIGEKQVQVEVEFEFSVSPDEPIPDWVDINNVQYVKG
ncbi:hypothetical protein AS19_18610 [Alcanivorax sp. NBRC 101098]|uniref:PIN domain-containing protein n=1 Tax=Alcanivorax sp. NBRC 101098 TaxID=1113728 RepID=UPI0004ABDA40|nr:PIN domain-containing protein [Alcanivorax sp. NBRC 101098]BAP14712.1 hypothetical protein AS19_18610 [Alcanivorax sp. NBRC 101098]